MELLVWLALFWATPVHASVLTVPIAYAQEIVWTPEMVKDLAVKESKKHGLNTKRFLAVIDCESRFEPKGQSNHYKNGVREKSYGAVQIYLPAHPTITREMAEDPSFAIPWMAEQWDKDNAKIWSCYQDLFL